MHTAISGIAGRNQFLGLLADELEQCRRDQRSLGLLLVDLQRFRSVNSAFGYDAGDHLLRCFAERLILIRRRNDSVGRLDGDQFALLMPGIMNGAHASLAANKLLAALQEPFEIAGRSIKIDVSMGLAIFPEHAVSAASLVQNAELALARARADNAPCHLYEAVAANEETVLLQIESELRETLEQGGLALYFQPKIALEHGELCGAEALMRWRHVERGLILPDVFIPLAEQTQLMLPLTLWSLNNTLRECAGWLTKSRDLSVAVNLSANVLNTPDVPGLIEQALRFWGVAPAQLMLEVTESAMMRDPVRSLETLHQLAAMGVGLSIDDFGTGYSSLAYMKCLPVHELKIDKSFVLNMANNKNDRMIVKSIIDLAHNFGMKVTAEGVEDNATLQQLADMGCDRAQGYFIAMPMPGGDLIHWVAQRGRVGTQQ
ncbi:MAG: putative bifunctional diguanylate cyclase/phosphodiesterase [Gammaproteobacteria bacterium]